MLEFLFHSVNAYGAPLIKYDKDFKDIIAQRGRILSLMLKLKNVCRKAQTARVGEDL